MSKKRKSIASNKSIFSPGSSNRIDHYLFANIITGLAIGAGSALATILIKALLKYIDHNTGVLPNEVKTELYGGKVAG
jgi:hypothetical protein